MAIAIPRTLEDITKDWLNEAMAERFPGIRIKSARADGFLGYKPNKARVFLEYEGERRPGYPETVYIKGSFRTNHTEKPSGIDVGNALEVPMYEEVLPDLDVNRPDCLYVRYDPKNFEGILILEDLEANGAQFLGGAHCLTYGQAAAFVEAMGTFHGQWLNSPEFAEGGRFGPDSPIAQRSHFLNVEYMEHMVRPHYWEESIALPRGMALPQRFRNMDRMAAAYQSLKSVHSSVGRTIIHGDSHLGNLHINDKGQPGFHDWCSRIEPWVNDFTYFVCSNLDSLNRREWERPLLARYLAAVGRCAEAPSFEEAWFFYRCSTMFPFLTWLNNAQWQPETVNTMNTVRAANAMSDHDVFGLLGV